MSLQDPSSSAPSNWPDGLQIRARTATDVAGLADLHNMPGYRSGTLRLPYQSADDVRRAIEAQGSSVTALVAVMDGRIVGDVGLHGFQGRRAHAGMIGMGVHDDYIRRGIGRALLGEIIVIAEDWLNLRRLELTVYTDNQPAIRLYERFGFQVEGTLRDYAYRAGRYVDAHAMARLRAEQADGRE